MRLNSITLHNIRSYIDQEIEFPLGTTLFKGDVGSGKSTILMAIEFALFGIGSQKGTSLLRLGENEGEVSLSFSMDGDYQITRKLHREKTSVSQKDGHIVTPEGILYLSATELKERVLKILNFRESERSNAQSVIYRYAIFTPQEEMKAILTRTSVERLQTLRKAFGIEAYKTASNNAKTLATRFKDEVNKLTGRIEGLDVERKNLKDNKDLNTVLEKKQEELIEEKKKFEALHNQHTIKLAKLQTNKEEYNKINSTIPLLKDQITEKLEGAKALEEQHNGIQKNNEEINLNIKELLKMKKPTEKTKETLKEEIEVLRGLEIEKKSLLDQQQHIEKEKNALLKKLENQQDNNSSIIKNQLASIEKKYEEIKENFEEILKKLESIGKESAKKEQKGGDIKKEIDKLKSLKSMCPICERELTDTCKRHLKEKKEKDLQENMAELTDLKKDEEFFELKKGKIEEKVDRLRADIFKLKNLKEVAEKLEENTRKLSKTENKIKEFDLNIKIKDNESFGERQIPLTSSHLEAIYDKLVEYDSSRKTLENLESQLNENKKQMNELTDHIKNDYSTIEKSRKTLEVSENMLSQLKDTHGDIKTTEAIMKKNNLNLQSTEKQIIENNAKKDQLIVNIKSLEEKIEKKEKDKKIYDKFQDYHVWINEFLVPSLDNIEIQVMATIKQEFESIFQRWYSMLFDEFDKEVRIDESFTPLVKQDGYDQEINDLSGGERTGLALAYRLTLNTIVQKDSTGIRSNLLILDEPTDGFSKLQLDKVRNVFKELNCPQVIIVSHETELDSFASQIYEVTKLNGMSSITKQLA